MAKSTKREIVLELGGLLHEKRLDDITVTELVERCGISRQAFYYHFSDLYGVVDYAIQGILDELRKFPPDEWKAALDRTVALLREYRTVVLNVYRAYERSYVEHDMRRWARPLVDPQVKKAAARCNVTQDQAEFVAELFTHGLVSIMLSWVEQGLPSSVIGRMDDFYILMEGSLDSLMERLAQKNGQHSQNA